MLLWDLSPLSSWFAGFLNKVAILCPNNNSNNTKSYGQVSPVYTPVNLKKKSTMWEFQVKFYLGRNEQPIALRNCSKEAGGKVSIGDSVEGEVHANKRFSLQKVFRHEVI